MRRLGRIVSSQPQKRCDLGCKNVQRSSNITRATKGDSRKIFSLFWVVNYLGPLCSRLYDGTMDVAFYHRILREGVRPVMLKNRRTPSRLEKFWHDHVTNAQLLHDPAEMNALLGRGKWLQFAPPICREQNGFIDIAAVPGKRVAHKRQRMSPKQSCDCKVKSGEFVPSSSPDLNLIEYANGLLRTNVYKVCNGGGKNWSGSLENKKQIVRDEIQKLADDSEYWQKLTTMIVSHAQKVIDRGGSIVL